MRVHSELSQMFPSLDNDLSSVGVFDQFFNSGDIERSFNKNSVKSGNATPISADCSDWEFNTCDATKGSSTTSCNFVRKTVSRLLNLF